MLSSHEEKIELPAEWEPQSASLLVWPHKDSDWHEYLNEVENTYAELSKAISLYQKLLIIFRDKEHSDLIISKLASKKISPDSYLLLSCDFNDTWCRDYGPIIVRRDGTLEIRNFVFDGWGKKYPSSLDNLLTQKLFNKEVFGSLELQTYEFILEGGSIDTDGHGTFLTTSRCLLKRHPDKSKEKLEHLLKEYLGANKVHWLNHGKIQGDDTDGHIDMLARFVNPSTIAYSACNNESHPGYSELKKMKQELSLLQQSNGEPYNLIPLELPETKMHKGKLLPASYVNFLIINRAVLVPSYDDPKDQVALDKIKQCFPERKVININSNTLIKQYGSLHCASMQLPAGAIA